MDGGGTCFGLSVLVTCTSEGCNRVQAASCEMPAKERTSMSGSFASSPVIGSCATEELYRALTILRDLGVCEGPAASDLQRAEERRMERSVDDMAVAVRTARDSSKKRWSASDSSSVESRRAGPGEIGCLAGGAWRLITHLSSATSDPTARRFSLTVRVGQRRQRAHRCRAETSFAM